MSAVVIAGCTACNHKGQNDNSSFGLKEQSTEVTEEIVSSTDIESSTDLQTDIEETSEEKTEKTDEINILFDEILKNNKFELSDEELFMLTDSKCEVSKSTLDGEWNRTNCLNGYYGQIQIQKKSDSEFTFTGDFESFAASGCAIEGGSKGYYISENRGIVIDNEILENQEYGAIFFLEEKDGVLTIGQIGDSMGFGMGVVASGEYVQGDPVYTNEHIMEENFDEKTQNSIKDLLEKNEIDYKDRFETIVKYGALTVEKDSKANFEDDSMKNGIWYDGYIPHDGYSNFSLFISEEGRLYYTTFTTEDYFATDDPNVTDMPSKVEE